MLKNTNEPNRGAIEMSNEPVVYISESTLKHCLEGNEICVRQNDELDDVCTIPLYTHPAKLTDEEILEIASPMFEDARYPSTALDFARAILRKAQE